MSKDRGPQPKARQLFWVGISVFIGLGVITAVWFLTAGTLPLTYALVMIPLSAIGVICIFNARMVKMEAGISKLHDLNSWVANHEDRIQHLEQNSGEVSALREEVAKLREHLTALTSPNVVGLDALRDLRLLSQTLGPDHG